MSNIRTIPVFLGIKKTEKLLLVLNSTLIPWFMFSYFNNFFHKYLFVLIVIIIYGYWYILYFCREGEKKGKSLDLLVDGEFILIAFIASVCYA